MANSFGNIIRITTFGESHGPFIGVVIDGCPAGLGITEKEIQSELDRRRPGQSHITSPRKEQDKARIVSGIFEKKTTGAPLTILIGNEDARPDDYAHLKDVFRPSHADYTYQKKYGHRDHRGGGRSSARETAARVAAGAVAKKFLKRKKIEVVSWVSQVGSLVMDFPTISPKLSEVESTIVRCPNAEMAVKMVRLVEKYRLKGDTIGGVITGVIKGVPPGLGEPVFDKLHAALGNAMLGINAVKGFEIGSGFGGVEMPGSIHNDIPIKKEGEIQTITNHSGGVQGGISNGQDIVFRVAFKPVATLLQDQRTINSQGDEVIMKGKGRHDPCVVPRAVPIVDAMAALVIADFYLLNRTRKV